MRTNVKIDPSGRATGHPAKLPLAGPAALQLTTSLEQTTEEVFSRTLSVTPLSTMVIGNMIEPLEIPDILLIKTPIFQDDRGFFSETSNAAKFAEYGLDKVFVQDNHSLSRSSGVVRGLHFQVAPHPQGKLIRVVSGSIYDVVVDIRRSSPMFGKHLGRLLSAESWEQLWVPVGFAHGFCTLEPDTEVVYKVTGTYAPECDRGILWSDPALNIDWPVSSEDAILSEKDTRQPTLAELHTYFNLESKD